MNWRKPREAKKPTNFLEILGFFVLNIVLSVSLTVQSFHLPPFPMDELLKKLAELLSAVNMGKDSL